MYTILLIDTDECYCADVYSDAQIVKLFAMESDIPRKMKPGGMSQHRFAQIRDNSIVLWFKDINEKLKTLESREITLGISHVYQARFMSYLSTYNKQKIKERKPIECANLAGIYDMINRLERDK